MPLPPQSVPRPSGLPPCGGSGLKWAWADHGKLILKSPSVWREWIEITPITVLPRPIRVSLRVEGVD